MLAFFRSQGLEVNTPDIDAFRAHAQRRYLESPMGRALAGRHRRPHQRRPLTGRSPQRCTRICTRAFHKWLRRRAENIAVLLVAMFLAFLAQILLRYLFNWAGWLDQRSVHPRLDLGHPLGRRAGAAG